METFDQIIVGGGIVGLAVAWTILQERPGTKVLLLEKGESWARHQTGRNSGVIHSGIYYKPGSLKAALCREGNRRLREFCQEQGIPFEICGKVIVATDAIELPQLEKLYQRGQTNGLAVRKMAPVEVREIEPHVQAIGGILVPSTGIVDYVAFCDRLVELITQAGGKVRTRTAVLGFQVKADEQVLATSAGDYAGRWIVNAAGLHSDRVARLAGARPEARIVPFRGEYYELRPERRHLVRNLIYPVPDPRFPFLGVHFTRMINGSVHAGPNAVLSLKREGYHRTSFDPRDALETMCYPGFWRLAAKHARSGLAEMHRSFSKQAFVRSLQRLVPEVQASDLVPSEAGVRAQALRPNGDLVDDFLIMTQARVTHVCNAPSPAATSCLEIARVIVDEIPNLTKTAAGTSVGAAF